MTEPEKIKYDLMCCLVLGGSEREKHEAMRNALMYINQLEQENERTMNSYDAAMCEAADVAAMLQRWICVKDQLPEVREHVAIIVRDEDGEYLRIGWMNSMGDWRQAGVGCVEGTVTQWLRIPDWTEVKGV